LTSYWDEKLPIDTVIATLLDPRTKFFHRIPAKEIGEAIKILKSEYSDLSDSGEIEQEPKKENPFSDLFNTPRKLNKKSKFAEEVDNFKKEDRLDMDSEPLLWWKVNEKRYPILGSLNHCTK